MASLTNTFDINLFIDCAKLLIIVHVFLSVALYLVLLLLGDKVDVYLPLNNRRKRTLLVTAHPDDECMFFSPVILSLTGLSNDSISPDVHVLCLTNGDFNGKGKVREKEILKSCHIFGIPADHVSVINNSRLPDDPKAEWDASALESQLFAAVNRIQPQQIVTFDDYGVSGHPNHITVSKAVRNIFQNENNFKGVERVYYLESVWVWRKYAGLLDLPFTCLLSSHLCLLSPAQVLLAQRAMLSHYSQLEWFRMLYILLSRYMLINSFQVQQRPQLLFSDT